MLKCSTSVALLRVSQKGIQTFENFQKVRVVKTHPLSPTHLIHKHLTSSLTFLENSPPEQAGKLFLYWERGSNVAGNQYAMPLHSCFPFKVSMQYEHCVGS